MAEVIEKPVEFIFDDSSILTIMLGDEESLIKLLEKKLNVHIYIRGAKVHIEGKISNSLRAKHCMQEVYNKIKKNSNIDAQELKSIINNEYNISDEHKESKQLKTRKKNITPYTKTQEKYVEALQENHVVFAHGPAGTGKTYLAVAYAMANFLERKAERIILTRPAVEAGEKIGYLPGDLQEKINPYLRPLYDAMYEMVPPELVNKLIETGEIEIAPLAFMRGRTLNGAIIILDEAQNTTVSQMKMFLTRLGNNSKMIITGDPSQNDLPRDITSGLADAIKRLRNIDGIKIIGFNEKDIIRHPITASIIEAYEKKKS